MGMRETLSTFAFVLRLSTYRDHDLVVTLLTQKRGKLTAIARGAKRSRRRFQGTLQPTHKLHVLCRSRDHTSGFWELCETELERYDAASLTHYAWLWAALQILPCVESLASPEQSDEHLFALLDDFLAQLAQPITQPAHLTALMRLQLLIHAGYTPRVDRCGWCMAVPRAEQPAYFDAQRASLKCRRCMGVRQFNDLIYVPALVRSQVIHYARHRDLKGSHTWSSSLAQHVDALVDAVAQYHCPALVQHSHALPLALQSDEGQARV